MAYKIEQKNPCIHTSTKINHSQVHTATSSGTQGHGGAGLGPLKPRVSVTAPLSLFSSSRGASLCSHQVESKHDRCSSDRVPIITDSFLSGSLCVSGCVGSQPWCLGFCSHGGAG